jgi:uncharacterized protein
MNILIPGGLGQLGTDLATRFTNDGHNVTLLARNAHRSPFKTVPWDGKTLGAWASELNSADVLINLAGRSVNCRYTPENRRQIMDSRIYSTRVLAQAIAQSQTPPKLWLQSSTATIYAHTFGNPNDELTGTLGGSEPNAPDTWRFSIDVATQWEQAAAQASLPRTRLVLLRSAMVMASSPGGAFNMLRTLARLGLGGPVAGGKQYMSWIHTVDFYRAINWLITHNDLRGPVNIASPNPIPQSDFMRALRQACSMPLGLPATKWMVELATFFLRSESELILKSRRVIPTKLIASGFQFNFPNWTDAAKNLCT